MSENKVPASQSSSWTAFLKSIASFNGDLASLTAPPFILSPVSLVEYSQFWYANNELFVAASKEEDPVQRLVLVLKWFIGTLRGQYCSRNEKLGSEKKPLNPFLGELFAGKWESSEDTDDVTYLASEQVSHHPPITGYSLWNDKHGVYVDGYNGIKARISTTTISVKQKGHATFYLKNFDETYIISLPALHIEGIIYGAPYVELEGKSLIQSSSGYNASIEYSGKGYFSGKKNTFKAKVYKESELNPLYRVSGQWSETSKIKDERTGKEVEFLNSLQIIPEPLKVKPEEEQSDLESRKAWSKVAAAIKKGDYELIHQEKSKIENDQRELRKVEKEQGITWPSKWFEEVPVEKASDIYLKLSKAANVEPETTWKFVRSKYEEGDVKP